jgi:FMN-dependent NADH-azoreductase
MKKVLIINASARTANSHSRALTKVFVDHWKIIHHQAVMSFRELGNIDVPHITDTWIAANQKPIVDRTQKDVDVLKISDSYIEELRQADIIVLGTPMYNWSIPSVLKAYIDQVLRVNETFRINPAEAKQPYIGLLENKTLCLLVARGDRDYESGQQNEHMNFQTTYLKMVFNMIGIRTIHVVVVDGTSLDKEQLKKSIAVAHDDIIELVERGLV